MLNPNDMMTVTVEVAYLAVSETVPPAATVTVARAGVVTTFSTFDNDAAARRYYNALVDSYGLRRF
jgi:hypothetical protein